MAVVKVSQEFITEYETRRRKAEEVFQVKYDEIRRSREVFDQKTPTEGDRNYNQSGYQVGNQPSADEEGSNAYFSRFVVPFHTAVVDMYRKDLMSNPFRFEFEGNTTQGDDTRRIIERKLRSVFAVENIKKKMGLAYWHYVVSGTIISQTVTEMKTEEIIYPYKMENKQRYHTETIPIGRTIDLRIYDPLRVYLDWNADPHDISGTAEWIIVTIGDFDRDYIKARWGIDEDSNNMGNVSGAITDNMKYGLETDRGQNKRERIPVREYYTNNGMRYVIVNDNTVVEASPNTNGIKGRIPFNIAPFLFDEDSLFGKTLFRVLEPSIEMASTFLNQIADNNALNNRMPFFALKGSGLDGITLNNINPNTIVELDPDAYSFAPGAVPDITKMITKFQIPDVSQSSLFGYQEAIKWASMLAGTNPTNMAGIQDKQIRTNDVAQMIQQAGLRSGSDMVNNLEINFMNPMTNDIKRIFYVYFEDFSFGKEVTKDMLRDLTHVRVVNGSYLPEDNMNRLGKTSFLANRAITNPNAYMHEEIERELIDTLGYGNPDRFLKDPEEWLKEQSNINLYNLVEAIGADEVVRRAAGGGNVQ